MFGVRWVCVYECVNVCILIEWGVMCSQMSRRVQVFMLTNRHILGFPMSEWLWYTVVVHITFLFLFFSFIYIVCWSRLWFVSVCSSSFSRSQLCVYCCGDNKIKLVVAADYL